MQALIDEAVWAHGGLHAGGAPLTTDVSLFFTYGLGSGSGARVAAGPPGVTWDATSDAEAVAALTVSGPELTLTTVGAGDAEITVTATDGTSSAQVTFGVTVQTPAPALPLAGLVGLGVLLWWLGRRRLAD